MESLKRYKKGYIRASSLIESVIAVTIITLCLLVALQLYVTVLEGRPSMNDYRLKFQVDQLVSEMKLNPSFDSGIYDFETYTIRKSVTDHNNLETLKKVSYSIQGQSDTITYHYLILKEDENQP
jgi:Tfp pilus assembly protein PilV